MIIAELKRPTIRPALPGVVACGAVMLAAAVGAGFGVTQIPVVLEFAILSLVAAATGLLVVRWPPLGLVLLPIVGALVPYSIGTGTQSPVVAALILAACLVFMGVLRAARSADWGSGALVSVPAVALMICWVLAYLWGNVELDPLVVAWPTFWTAQLGGLAVLIISVGLFLVAMRTSWEGPWAALATAGIIGCGVIGLVAYFAFPDHGGRLLEGNGLFTLWVVTMSFGQALFNTRLPVPLRIALVVLALGWEYKALVLTTWWFSGWFPPLVAIAILLLLRSRLMFAVAAAVSGFLVFSNFDVLYQVVWGTTVAKGDLSRLDIWRQSLDLFSQHPLLGTGPAGYAIYFQNIYAGSAFSLSSHNTYVDLLLETGVVGEVVFLWFLIALLVAGWRARTHWRVGFRGAFAQSAFAGLIAAIFAMAQGDWVIPFVYNIGIGGFRYTVHNWVFLGLLAGLALVRPAVEEVERTSQVSVARPLTRLPHRVGLNRTSTGRP